LVSDVGAKNLEFARRQLGGEEKGVVYRTLKLEDSVDAVLEETEGKQGVDMVFAATMIHFCDIDRALSAVAKQLKPGGTFAALATGRFVMDDERARGLWEDLLNANLWVILERRGGEDSGVMGIVDVAASAYDAIPLPEEYFEAGSRKRVKVNFGMDEGIKGTLYRCMVPPELREKHPLVSRVTEAEVVEWVDEDEGWRESKGIDEIRENLESLTVDLGAEKVKDIWEELVKVVGDRKMEGRWLAWCLLATKRTET
jgi:SAM-dependent methyltransferase